MFLTLSFGQLYFNAKSLGIKSLRSWVVTCVIGDFISFVYILLILNIYFVTT